jgi:two-component system sensor histidine kinase EvgS
MATHRILVVEPHALNRMVLTEQLATLGHATACAEDGDHALRLLATHEFDVAFVACRMQGIDGFSLSARVRDDARRRGVRAVAMIGCSDAVDVDATLAAQSGMRDCLAMPASTPALQLALRAALACTDPAASIVDAQWPLFARTSMDDLRTARDALARGDRATVREALHRIKGAASMIGAHALARACAAGETAVMADAGEASALVAIDAVQARLDEAATAQANR